LWINVFASAGSNYANRCLFLAAQVHRPILNHHFLTVPMKTFKLEVDYDYDFELFGLVSSSKEHKLAWALNKCFHIRLIKQQDLNFDFFNKGRLVISNYLHLTDHSTFRLLRNKSVDLSTLKKPFLVPDIKEYDYIIQITGALSSFYQQELTSRFKLVPLIQYVKQFDPNSLKFKENLMF
jgi:hypothetical protein